MSDLTFNHGGRWDLPGTPAVETSDAFDHYSVRVVVELVPDVASGNNGAETSFAQVSPTGRLRTNVLLGNLLQTEVVGQLVVSPPLPRGWQVVFPEIWPDGVVRIQPGGMSLATIDVAGPSEPGAGRGPGGGRLARRRWRSGRGRVLAAGEGPGRADPWHAEGGVPDRSAG